MKRYLCIASVVAVLVLAVVAPVAAEVKLPAVIGSNMVLQRDVDLPIWGWAEPGEKVTVRLGKAEASATAEKDGKWRVSLPAVKYVPNRPALTMTVQGKNKIELKNILIGEVWVGSGQSNMEFRLSGSYGVKPAGAKDAIAKADLPNVRLFHVRKVRAETPAKDVQAAWKACSPKTVPTFSAVLFYFGRRLNEELKMPIGLINSSWGGSPIEPWTVAHAGQKANGRMYNAMIAPLQPFAVRGVIWYQGETNVMQKNGWKYYGKMKALIEGWRKTWNNEKLSFYFVQIAPWAGRYAPGQLPALWEAQAASVKIPGTGMAVITDLVDDIRNIHPGKKLPVGNRLALWALAKDYGRKEIVYSGPLYVSMKVEGDKIRLSFAHVGGGLISRDGKDLSEFQIAGADGKFVPAKATIDGKTVVVSADGVAAPKQVRFGWRKTANPNLANKAHLPASPFQTDNWRGGTGKGGETPEAVEESTGRGAKVPAKINFEAVNKSLRCIAKDLKFTEGPVWLPDKKCLLFSDIPADTIYRWSKDDGLKVFRRPSHNSNGNILDLTGRLLTCEHGSRTLTRTEKDGKVTTLASSYKGKKLNSPNDLAVKSDGTIWFTDPPYGLRGKKSEQPANYVFRLDPGKTEPVAVVDDMARPNGICFSPDEKYLYVANSGKAHHVRRFAVKADNTLAEGKVFVTIDPGGPDGMRVDSSGRLYSTAGNGVQVFSPAGKLLGVVRTPKGAANCAFGGPDGTTLFITARDSVWAADMTAK